MHLTSLRIAVLTSALLWPFVAFAAPAPNVTGLSAHFENGQITVEWNAYEEGADIATYRIYYSQKSILSNDGAYDDFATTTGKNTSFIFPVTPPYPQIFIAVAAVNSSEEESRSFVEEIRLDLTTGDSNGLTQQEEIPTPSRRVQEATTIGLLSAAAQSPDTVELTFSETVTIPAELATEAFRVIDRDGNGLQLRRIVIRGSIVILTTDSQIPAMPYAIRANEVITGGASLPMDSARSFAQFSGFGEPGSVPPPRIAITTANIVTARMTRASGSLTSSGVPVLGVVLASGAMAGWKRARRKA